MIATRNAQRVLILTLLLLISSCFIIKKQLRAIYYITITAVEDEENQRKGIVGIVYNLDKAASNELDDETSRTRVHSVQLRNALPAQYVSMHYCFNNDAFMNYINREIFCV